MVFFCTRPASCRLLVRLLVTVVTVVTLVAVVPNLRAEAKRAANDPGLESVNAGGPLKVMAFNIRYPNPRDGENRWENRADLVAETILAYDPDLLGLQEVFPVQVTFLRERLAGSHEILDVPRQGVSRAGGIGSPVAFRRDRFERVEDGTFWLSEDPDATGSTGWDASMPRLVRWVRLRDKEIGDPDRTLYFFNTHFDHKGPVAKLESARLLRREVTRIAGDSPAIVVGDFNTLEEMPGYAALVGSDREGGSPLIDSYRTLHPVGPDGRRADETTFHAFTGRHHEPARIDWVLHSPGFHAVEATIDRADHDGRYASDHFPVTATLVDAADSGHRPTGDH